jgi:hypothetical protein
MPRSANNKNWNRKDFISAAFSLSALAVLPKMVTASELVLPERGHDGSTGDRSHPQKAFPARHSNKQLIRSKFGAAANQMVTGIVTTMFATVAVIEKAAKAGANFIIAHEPTFYNHAGRYQMAGSRRMYTNTKSPCSKNTRSPCGAFHDYIHAHKPDGVMAGVLAASMGWEKYMDAETSHTSSLFRPRHCSRSSHSYEKRNLGHRARKIHWRSCAVLCAYRFYSRRRGRAHADQCVDHTRNPIC